MSEQSPFYEKFESRVCAVCGGNGKTLLYRQQFSRMSNSSLVEGYDIVVCTSCGFAFADRLPSQRMFDRYYREMSKYEFHESGGKESEYDAERFRDLLGVILPYLTGSNNSIIDIGCATGRLLSLLAEKGFRRLVGLDPSPGCALAAEKLYGIKVLTGSVAKVGELEETFDCMILAGILEHVCDLKGMLALLTERLAESGIICIQVPDASRFSLWPDAPFQQFSIEHINYFSSVSLRNFMARSGFSEITSVNGAHPQSATTMMPVVTSVFRKKMDFKTGLICDEITERGLYEYVRQSTQVEDSIREIIGRLVTDGTPLIVWGAGTHTLHLLETTALRKANIRAYVDANIAYHGKLLHGIPILSPEALREMPETILVSSRVFQDEIVCRIRDELRLSNLVVVLYDLKSVRITGKGANHLV